MTLKLKLIISNVLLAVITLLLVGVTIAYFSDTAQISNTLTSGSVKIMLSESAVKKDKFGNLVADNEATKIFGGQDATLNDYGKIHPGQTIYKDPTILNTGTNNAWIAAQITFEDGNGDLQNVMKLENKDGIDIKKLLSGGILEEQAQVGMWNGLEDILFNDHFAMVQIPNASEGEYAFFIFYHATFAQGDTEMLFDTLKIPREWNNEEMQELANLNIKVQAFASQTEGMENCLHAMRTAFPDYFHF